MTLRLDPSGADEGVVLNKPPIHATSWDYQRLSGVVEAFRSRGREPLVEFLSDELDRAELVEPAAVPPDVVTMHSCVRFIDHDTDEVRCITLVYPGEEDSRQGRIAIITPVGSALLGLRPGATMAWRTMDGRIKRLSVLEVRLSLMEWTKRLGMDDRFQERYLNEGFSGGEKKRNEVLQMAMLQPEVAILDETDSGLDIDALKVVAKGVNEVRDDRPEMGTLVITHYQRLLDHLAPEFVHILVDGRIVESGGPELANRLEREGYESWR